MAKIERDDSVRRLSDLQPLEPVIPGVGTYSSIALPLVRRQFPQLFASSLVSVVPMSSSNSYGTGNAGKGRKPKKQKSLLSFNPKTQRKIIK